MTALSVPRPVLPRPPIQASQAMPVSAVQTQTTMQQAWTEALTAMATVYGDHTTLLGGNAGMKTVDATRGDGNPDGGTNVF
jgi:hypothetical protein